MAEPFLGQISMFAGNFAPRGWAYCDGQLLAISQNTALFSILGTTYGGDGRSSFGLPDLRGRFPMHPGHGPGLTSHRWGERGGREEYTLSISEMPSHSHTGTMHAESAQADSNSPINRLLAFPLQDDYIYSSSAPTPNQTMHADSLQIRNTGGGQPFPIVNPYTCIYFIIALQGIFPSRN
jgi:microcystin-dependent protein